MRSFPSPCQIRETPRGEMTEARLNEIARNTPRTFDGIKSAILTACEAESKLAAAAMVEKCAEICKRHKEGMLANGNIELARQSNQAEQEIRSISPAGVLDELLFKAKGEALASYKKRKVEALRATPQPTAVKEER